MCDKVIQLYKNMYLFFLQIMFPFRLLRNIQQSSLCCAVGPCCFSILFYLFFEVDRIALLLCQAKGVHGRLLTV